MQYRKLPHATGGELIELVPVEPYMDEDLDYIDDNSRVSQEHEDESLRHVELVEDTVEDWSAIKNVDLSYPIWWSQAAWPIDTFIEANDFTGKTVIPFCTRLHQDWEKAEKCWRKWQEQEIGWRECGSGLVLQKKI